MGKRSFFISFNKADREWAVWIAWVLEGSGYSTIVEPWDFRPGSNFVVEMDRATTEADCTIAVLSEHYFQAEFVQSEWAAAFAHDPTGSARRLIPVKVSEYQARGLLGQLVPIDLIGLEEKDAIQELVTGVRSGRAKPTSPPDFPRREERSVRVRPEFPGPVPSCPVCGKDDLVAKVTAIVASQVRRITGTEPMQVLDYDAEGRARLRTHNVPFSRREATELADRLQPPTRRSVATRSGAHLTKMTLAALLGLGGIGMASIPILCFVSFGSALPGMFQDLNESTADLFAGAVFILACLLPLLILGIGTSYLSVRAYRGGQRGYREEVARAAQERKQAEDAYRRAYGLYRKLYYCGRDDVLFLLGETRFVPASEMGMFVHA